MDKFGIYYERAVMTMVNVWLNPFAIINEYYLYYKIGNKICVK